jgi:integrase
MAIHKLSPRWIETVKTNGTHPDGGGLYLQVSNNGRGKSWIFRYTVNGRRRDMGLGPLHTISLAEARDRALKCRQQRLDGIDPIEARDRAELDRQMARAKEIPFRRCAEGWMAVQEIGWNPKTAAYVRRKFEKYVFPLIGDLPVQRLDVESPDAVRLLHDVLMQEISNARSGKDPKPLWTDHYPTARYIQEHIEGVLNWAQAQRYINNSNAASLKGPLGILLPKGKNFHQTQHLAALPFKEVGQFMADLRAAKEEPKHPSNAALVLQFLILTGVRKGQVTQAKWQDIVLKDDSKPDWNAKDVDLENAIWVCSHHKTKKKTGQDHVVLLSRQAIAVIERMRDRLRQCGIEIKPDGYIFSGRFNRGISNATLNMFVERTLKRKDTTIHGFRTTFKVWSIENGFPEQDSEMALNHVIGTKTRNAYVRGLAQKLEPRRTMMQAWADYCDQTKPMPATVTSLGQFKAAKKQDQA